WYRIWWVAPLDRRPFCVTLRGQPERCKIRLRLRLPSGTPSGQGRLAGRTVSALARRCCAGEGDGLDPSPRAEHGVRSGVSACKAFAAPDTTVLSRFWGLLAVFPYASLP